MAESSRGVFTGVEPRRQTGLVLWSAHRFSPDRPAYFVGGSRGDERYQGVQPTHNGILQGENIRPARNVHRVLERVEETQPTLEGVQRHQDGDNEKYLPTVAK